MNETMQNEASIASILNLIPYLDYNLKLSEPITLGELVENYEDVLGNKKYFKALKMALDNNKELAKFELVDQSCNHPGESWSNPSESWKDDPIQGCTFRDPDGNYYVAYRGTGDGRWLDNAEGMTKPSTEMQQAAADYFDAMAEKYLIDASNDGKKIIVTGHSKGGNEAQYTYMAAKHEEIIDNCISLDGQGFSASAIEDFKERLGKRYEEKLQKMYSVNGQNDYVHGLGIPIIPPENTYFVPTSGEGMADYHDLYNMVVNENGEFTGLEFIDPQTGDYYEQGDLGAFVDRLSQELMKLDPEDIDGASMVIMALLDRGNVTIGSAEVQWMDYFDLVADGVPLVIRNLFLTKEGLELTHDLVKYGVEFLYEKYGVGGVIGGIVIGAVLFVGVIVPLIFDIVICGAILDYFIDIGEMIVEISIKVGEFFAKVKEYAVEVINKIISKALSCTDGYKQAVAHPSVKVDTYELRGYASRLWEVNRRVTNLDGRIDGLYREVGLLGLWNLMQADLLMGYSWRLDRCANYLTETAADFESVERELSNAVR